jgi:hypothetical protein
MVGVIPCSFILGIGTLSANVGGYSKKITAQAIFFIVYCVGSKSSQQPFCVNTTD